MSSRSAEHPPFAVRAENLGKQYQLGSSIRHDTLRDALAQRIWGNLQGRSNKAPTTSFWALRDLSFEIPLGATVGILGRNGAGKSTLLKILSRIVRPSEGYLEAYGRVGSLLEVGTGFHAELSGRENIYLSGAILGMKRSEIQRKFRTIVEFAEIDSFLDTPVKRYSTGMYLRLGFAVAAHLEPEILVVDEVLAVGDAAFQQKCLNRMRDVADQGCTILFVSHNTHTVRKLCDRALWLDRGKLVQQGTAAVVVEQYLASLEHESHIPVRERTSRGGSGETRLVDIAIFGSTDPQGSRLQTGAPALFEFRFEPHLANVTCSFTIYDPYGQPITYFDSSVAGQEDMYDNPDACFRCCIDSLLLLPGKYRINAALARDGQLLDHLEGACVFEVEGGLLRGRMVPDQGAYGAMQLPHTWKSPSLR